MSEPAAGPARGRILLLDDDRALREMAADFLRGEGHDVDDVGTLEQARAMVRARPYDLVLSDLVLQNGTGLDLLREIRHDALPCDVIIMTGHGGIEAAVEAIRHGAYNFITKPLSLARLSLDVAKTLEKRRLEADLARLREGARTTHYGGLVGASPPMQTVFNMLARAASANSNVLLLGESGTGKEVAARAIHDHSARANGPFVPVNCGALPADLLETELFGHVKGAFTGAERDRDGLFVAANGGTLFLDEVGAAPARVQVGLLRALQERRVRPVGTEADVEVDVRIVAATNADLEEAMSAGSFRQDLYYRLAGIVVHLPALRDRRGDIPLLASEILARLAPPGAAPITLAPRAFERLVAHDWPGNVRELVHLLERASLLVNGSVLGERDLGLPAPAEARVPTLEEVERDHVARVLALCAGNKLRAARLLGIPRATLYRKIERFGLEPLAEDARPAVLLGSEAPLGYPGMAGRDRGTKLP